MTPKIADGEIGGDGKLVEAHRWQFIQDLSEDDKGLAVSEIASLAAIWREQKKRLQNSDALRSFNERLAREWAIETGVLENLYTIDRGITSILIEKGIESSLIPHGATNRPPELVVALVQDQQEALEGLFDFIGGRRQLSTSYIKELHQVFTRHQATSVALDRDGKQHDVPLRKGEWKQWPNNPTRPSGEEHEYTPPEHVDAEMERLIAMHARHLEAAVAPEVASTFLHHRFTQIHPFQDGNGRVARALASLVFMRDGWFPVVITRDMRDVYIGALEEADAGRLASLVGLFAKAQRAAFLQALSLSENVLRTHEPVEGVIRAAIERLSARREERRDEWRGVFDLARRLELITEERLQHVCAELEPQLHNINRQYGTHVDRSDSSNDHWFKHQIVDGARKFQYYADTRSYRAWVGMRIREERTATVVVSFHSLGVDFLGVMAVSAFLEYRDRDDAGQTAIEGPYILCDDIFQFAYNESPEAVVNRFEGWISQVILLGLDQWRRQL